MYVGDYIRTNKDRAYTIEEIHHLLEFCDERAKALVFAGFNWHSYRRYTRLAIKTFEKNT